MEINWYKLAGLLMLELVIIVTFNIEIPRAMTFLLGMATYFLSLERV